MHNTHTRPRRRLVPALLVTALFALALFAGLPRLVPLNAAATVHEVTNSGDLQDAFTNAGNGDIILVGNDFPLNTIVTLPAGKNVTLTSAPGGTRTLTRTSGGARLDIQGTLRIEDLTLDGASDNVITALVTVSSTGAATLGSGATVQNAVNTGGIAHGGGI